MSLRPPHVGPRWAPGFIQTRSRKTLGLQVLGEDATLAAPLTWAQKTTHSRATGTGSGRHEKGHGRQQSTSQACGTGPDVPESPNVAEAWRLTRGRDSRLATSATRRLVVGDLLAEIAPCPALPPPVAVGGTEGQGLARGPGGSGERGLRPALFTEPLARPSWPCDSPDPC